MRDGLAEREFVLHRLRHFGADHTGTAKLGVHAAGPVILDQKGNLVTLLDDTVLQMPVGEFRWRAERHRCAKIDAIFAAVTLAIVLRNSGNLGVAHPRFGGGKGGAHGAVLHQRGALHQFHLFRDS